MSPQVLSAGKSIQNNRIEAYHPGLPLGETTNMSLGETTGLPPSDHIGTSQGDTGAENLTQVAKAARGLSHAASAVRQVVQQVWRLPRSLAVGALMLTAAILSGVFGCSPETGSTFQLADGTAVLAPWEAAALPEAAVYNNLERPVSKNFFAAMAIKEVVLNKARYFNTDLGQAVYFKDYYTENYLSEEVPYKLNGRNGDHTGNRRPAFDFFLVFDMDGDGAVELLLIEPRVGDIFVFHYEDRKVFGCVYPFRGMKSIKIDGTFESSSGALLINFGRLIFNDEKAMINVFTYLEGRSCKSGDVFTINGRPVSWDEFEACFNRQDSKEELILRWYTAKALFTCLDSQ